MKHLADFSLYEMQFKIKCESNLPIFIYVLILHSLEISPLKIAQKIGK